MRFIQRSARWFTLVWQYMEQHICTHAQLPRWRHPLVGYIASLFLVGLSLAARLVETRYLTAFTFPGLLLLFVVVPIALFWSIGPALFTILLGIIILDYFYVPPLGTLGNYGWNGLLQIMTFAAASSIIAILTHQREVARLQALEARNEATARTCELEAMFDAISDGIVVYDRQGRVVQTNAATQSLFGVQTLHINEQKQEQQTLLLQAARSNAQGELTPASLQPLTRLLHGETLTGNGVSDVLVQTPAGRKVIFNLSGSPIYNATGTVERAVLIYRDVTDHRHLEQRTSEALQALLAMAHVLAQTPELPREAIPLPSAPAIERQVGQRLVELAGSVIESIHVVLLAVEQRNNEEVIYPVTAQGFTVEQEQQWRRQLAHALPLIDYIGSERLIPYLQEGEVLLLDGMSLPLYTPVLPFYVQTVLVAPICIGKRLVGLLCIDDGSREHAYTATEMTLAQTTARLLSLLLARTQLQREYTEMQAHTIALRETTHQMEEFLSMICHELKTPLTVLQGSLQLAERKLKRLAGTEKFLGEDGQYLPLIQNLLTQAENQVILQTRLINDLLDVARTRAQTLRFCMRSCNLIQIVQEAVAQQHQVAPERKIHLHLPDTQTLPVYADPDRLTQVMTNFLSNALKYSPAEKPIDVWLNVEQEQVRVHVRDEGPGVPLTEQQRIWERFYRVPGIQACNTTESGLGVGLYLCRTIVEQHSGQVGVDSLPEHGSTFWFTLPLAQTEIVDDREIE